MYCFIRLLASALLETTEILQIGHKQEIHQMTTCLPPIIKKEKPLTWTSIK